MKKIILLGLLALITVSAFYSCDLVFTHESDAVYYKLELNYQDAFGNDLVHGIELEEWCCPTDISQEYAQKGIVKRDLYVIDVIPSQACQDVIVDESKRPLGYIPDDKSLRLGMNKFNGLSYLTTEYGFTVKGCPDEKILTYKVKCPYVFGDEAEYVFVTYWEIPKIQNHVAYAKCTRLDFEGKVFSPVIVQEDNSSKVIIILDGADKSSDKTNN